jgi:hypothetical protein
VCHQHFCIFVIKCHKVYTCILMYSRTTNGLVISQ